MVQCRSFLKKEGEDGQAVDAEAEKVKMEKVKEIQEKQKARGE